MIGTTLSHYQIEAELGRGGMGIVYRAKDTKLDRTVAIKVLPASALSSEDDRARFYREAKSAAALNHPHIAQVYQIDEAVPEGGSSEEPRPFIAMEFIDGQTLDAAAKGGPMSLEEAVRISIQVAQALELAHENNIVHRDIKSANVMLTKKGEAKVLDFGLAKTAHSTMLTRMGSTLGTVAYMSPEQARGENVDHRTDLWALGILLYELVAGRLPFAGDYEQAVTYSILNEDAQPLTSLRTGVPMGLEWIVSKLLAKKADDRYQSAKDLIVDLRTVDLKQIGLSRISSVSGMPAASSQVVAAQTSTSSLRLLGGVLLVLGLLIGWAGSFLLLKEKVDLPVRHYTQFFKGMSDTRWPAVSPAGRYLAVGGRDSLSNQPQLHIWDLQANRRFTVANSESPEWPVFSPDESRIAFTSSGKLKIANVIGGEPIEISGAAPEMVQWDEDGSVYFASASLELSRVSPDGKVELVQPADSVIKNFFPNDIVEDHILLARNEDNGDVSGWTLNLKTGELQKFLNQNAWYLRYLEPGFLLVQTSQNGQLLAYPFSKSKMDITGLPQPFQNNVSVSDWFSTKSGYFASMLNSGSGSLEMMTLNDDGEMTVLIESVLDYEEFQFSPSGRSIVAEINGYENGQDQILLFDLQEGILRQLTFTESYFEPTMSPDESRVAFASNANSAQNIAILRLDGVGEKEWITANSHVSGDPDWAPSGGMITFDQGSESNELDIWMYSLQDGESKALVEDPGNQMYPRFSHSSRYIAYQSNQTRTTQVWVFDMLTGAKTKVSQHGGFRPVWGPDDRVLYFSNGVELVSIDVSTSDGFAVRGQEKVVVEVGVRFFFDVSDQGRIAIAKQSGESALSMELIQNFPQTLIRPE